MTAPEAVDIQALASAVQALQASSERVDARLARGDERMGAIETELRANTEITSQVRDLLEVARGGLRALGWLGVGAKWVAGLAGAAVAIWHAIQKFRGN